MRDARDRAATVPEEPACPNPHAHLRHTGRLGRETVDGLGVGELARPLSYVVEIAADTWSRAGTQPRYGRDGVSAPAQGSWPGSCRDPC